MEMANARQQHKILIVDDEWQSSIVKTVRRRIEREGWLTVVVDLGSQWTSGEEFETAALYAIDEERPDGVLLDVNFGGAQG